MSTTVIECGPPNFSRLNFFLSTRICEQSSVSAEVSVKRRNGTVTESVVVRMIAPERQGNGDLEQRTGRRRRKWPNQLLMSDKNWSINRVMWFVVGASYCSCGKAEMLEELQPGRCERFRVDAKLRIKR